ncbi:hypothetical protein [uncultured Dubosiella sp.]|nr:hypothetical protein [uncultured Dubosiella sp.]
MENLEIHRLVWKMDRRMTRMSAILQESNNNLSHKMNSSSFICVENDKSTRSFTNPGSKICERITREQQEKLFLIETMAMLNALPEEKRKLLYDFFVLKKSKSFLVRKYKIKDVKGALYFSLLDLATLDPDLDFSRKESAIFEDKCKRHQKRVDEKLNVILEDVDRLKRQLVDGYHHHHLKKIPLLSNDVPNEHFFQQRPGSDRRDYKRRSLLAFALYCIQNPDTPAEVIERFLAKFDFGQNFMKKVKAFIEKGGFNHEG